MRMEEQIYVALDLELTGLEVGEDEIIEVGAVQFKESGVLDTLSCLVKPQRSLPLKITRMTGITPEMLAHAPTFDEIAPKLTKFISHYPIIGHSVHRDLEMLGAEGLYTPQTVYDTFDLATLLLPHMSAYKLVTLADYLGVEYPEAHRALQDAEASRLVFLRFLDIIRATNLDSLNQVNRLMSSADWALRDIFRAIQQEKARTALTSDTPISSTSEPVEYGPLWGHERPDDEKPLKPTENTDPLDPDAIAAFFAPDGAISMVFDNYEQRTQQVDMALAVTESFNQGGSLLVEAGTGTGKSMAYLVPAAQMAIQRGERVVISTQTINLQDQLFFKDIPDVQRMLVEYERQAHPDIEPESKLHAALLKGRSNYLCLLHYKRMLRDIDALMPEESRLLLKIHFWLETTTSGDGTELMLTERERSAWTKVNVPPDTCTGARCSEFFNCYFFKARRRAEAVHLVVVNHALMLADLATESRVLPPYNHLIVDEAHTLEDVATDQLSFSLNQEKLTQFLDALSQTGGTRTVSGILSVLPVVFREGATEQKHLEQLNAITDRMYPEIDNARETMLECFESLTQFLVGEADSGSNTNTTENLYDTRLRITDSIRRKEKWHAIKMTWSNLTLALMPIGDGLGKLESLLIDMEEADLPDYDELFLQVQGLKRYAAEARITIDYIITGNEEYICWLTLDRSQDRLHMNVAPLNVADILQKQLFVQKQTTILTSATLTINETFTFIRKRLGLDNPVEVQLDSPFDYQKQALVYIPNDIPEPNQRGYQQMIEEALITLCTATGGRTLALFTANSAVRKTRSGIQDALEEEDIIVLGQGVDGSRRNVLERFREWSRMVLLGTSSFWQGVDVVGDALSVLVIAKLPFNVPTDPIFAARSEQFGDPFQEYSVPQSILRFKQGFGRLIRSKEDRGIVVVLDRRLLSKRYGSLFLQSLPLTSVREGPLKVLPSVAKRFLEKK